MPIRRLPPLLVNQIAAGEVVERPASVVKELVENSLDAGATRIVVEIEQGGRELIRVVDDGAGIAPEELPLAVAQHATSKIESAQDLAAVRTLGFRGEALASIASVSRMRLLSRRRGADEAALLEIEGDAMTPVRPASGAPGTTIEARTLFFNTPARRKFLKTDATEAGRISELVSTMALAHPAVGFTLRQDGRTTLELASGHSRRERVIAVLGKELAPELLEAAAGESGEWVRVWGLVGTPATARATGRHLRLFLNGRVINDRLVVHAVRDAYRGLIDPSRHPTAALFLDVEPTEVDVNVHPTKAEVRFRNGSAIHQVVRRAVRGALHAADLVPEFDLNRAGSGSRSGAASSEPGASRAETAFPTPSSSTPSAAPFSPAWSRETDGSPSAQPSGATKFGALGFGVRGVLHAATASGNSTSGASSVTPGASAGGASRRAGLDDASGASPSAPAASTPTPIESMPNPVGAVRVLQVHDAYLVLEDEQGLRIIDQHALHERAMFERIHARLTTGPLERQRLLIPAVIGAGPARMEAIERLAPLLRRLGVDAEPNGPSTIAIHALPTLLFERRVDPVRFLESLLDRAGDESVATSDEAALTDVVAMMACKAAVKAGDRLRPGEIDELLRLADSIDRSSACPHGRPTTLRISLRELDRQFGR